MKSLKAILVAFLVVTTATRSAIPLPEAKPILTSAELQAAAQEVPVGKIDFVVPFTKDEAESALSKKFFNQPEEHRYSGVTNEAWEKKWQMFSDALIENAKTAKLPAQSLESCLKALNRGRNRQTMAWPAWEQKNFPLGTPDDVITAFEKKSEEKYQQALAERDKNPEPYYNDNLAIIPVAAYLARHTNGECWIIVCKWEMISANKEILPLGHIMVWAMDMKTFAVVGYVTCD